METAKKKVLIGGAWPYANGSLHLGHIACLLPGDIIARYYRACGHEVCFVSGSDCHGTPITVKAEAEGVSPGEVAERYHREFADNLSRLGFSYDLYGSTMEPFHKEEVRHFFSVLVDKGYLTPVTTEQTYCQHCGKFLPDRYVEGRCPKCGSDGARGDQCEACGALLSPGELLERHCKICGREPDTRETEHLYFRLSAFQDRLEELADNSPGWKANAVGLTKRYLKEGLVDRAATRDIDWGIEVPLEGYEGKRIYVWFEAVMGYLTASKKVFADAGDPEGWKGFWSEDAISYYAHGKDNIPFHTLIWPALLLAVGGLKLPERIISSEYLTIEGKKLSTSRNWAVWVSDYLERYDPDPIRYFLTINGPESRDADFSWREFVERNNGELLGGYGNFVHRTLAFINKNFDSRVPEPQTLSANEAELLDKGDALFAQVGGLIEDGGHKEALKLIFEYVRTCNKYFDVQQPWVTVTSEPYRCKTAIYCCVQAIARLCSLCAPFLPFSSEKIRKTLNGDENVWAPIKVAAGQAIGLSEPPFRRIDRKVVDEEVARLGRE